MSKLEKTFATSSISSRPSTSCSSRLASLPSTFTVFLGTIAISALCTGSFLLRSAWSIAWSCAGGAARIPAALLGGDRDFANQTRKHRTALLIGDRLLPLDLLPLTVTSHIPLPPTCCACCVCCV